jgi:hypothetical protein
MASIKIAILGMYRDLFVPQRDHILLFIKKRGTLMLTKEIIASCYKNQAGNTEALCAEKNYKF